MKERLTAMKGDEEKVPNVEKNKSIYNWGNDLFFYRKNTYEQYGGYSLLQNAEFKQIFQ